jgi:hypothetical protein
MLQVLTMDEAVHFEPPSGVGWRTDRLTNVTSSRVPFRRIEDGSSQAEAHFVLDQREFKNGSIHDSNG